MLYFTSANEYFVTWSNSTQLLQSLATVQQLEKEICLLLAEILKNNKPEKRRKVNTSDVYSLKFSSLIVLASAVHILKLERYRED
jgi:hypothetical protein